MVAPCREPCSVSVVRDGESPSFTGVVREAEPCSVSVISEGEPPAFTSVAREVYAMAGTTAANVVLTTP